MNKIKIRIMGVPRLQNNINKLVEELGLEESDVFYAHPEVCNPYLTSKSAFTASVKKNITHIIVLQDDVEVCDNFAENALKVINEFPDSVISFFNCLYKYPSNTRNYFYFKKADLFTGQALCIPVKYIKDMFEWCDENADGTWIGQEDDTSIRKYAEAHDIPLVGTLVSLVQHKGIFSSSIGNKKAIRIISANYRKDLPNKIDWSKNNLKEDSIEFSEEIKAKFSFSKKSEEETEE